MTEENVLNVFVAVNELFGPGRYRDHGDGWSAEINLRQVPRKDICLKVPFRAEKRRRYYNVLIPTSYGNLCISLKGSFVYSCKKAG